MKRWLSPLIAIVVVAGLLGYVYWWHPRQQQAQTAAQDTKLNIVSVKTSDIAKVTIKGGKLDFTAYHYKDSAWRLRDSGGTDRGLADSTKVQAYLDENFDPLRAVTKLANPEAPSEYGLTTPQYVETLTLNDGSTITLNLGSANPVTGDVYGQVVGHPGMYLFSSLIVSGLPQTLTDWAAPKPSESAPAGSESGASEGAPSASGGSESAPAVGGASESAPAAGGGSESVPTGGSGSEGAPGAVNGSEGAPGAVNGSEGAPSQ